VRQVLETFWLVLGFSLRAATGEKETPAAGGEMRNKFRFAVMALAFFATTVGFAAAQRYRDYDRDDYRYDRGNYNSYDRDDYRRGMQVARTIGFEDGEQTAREDAWRGKPFNPYPRGHNHADRGYARDFGSIQEYRQIYAQAYRQGYSRTFQRNGYYQRNYNW
jgi:hypothetical protein